MIQLYKELEDVKDDFDEDINVRIVLKEINDFMKEWKDFIKDFDTSKKRITEIEKKAGTIYTYLSKRISKLKKVKTIDKDEIAPLEKYLKKFRSDVDKHLDKQRKIYNKTTASRK